MYAYSFFGNQIIDNLLRCKTYTTLVNLESDLWCNLPLLSGMLSRGLITIIWWQYVVQKYRFWPFLGFFKPKNMITRPEFLSIWKLYSGKKTHWAHQLDTLYRVGVQKYQFITQLDTVYCVGVHNLGYAYQIDTMYRVEDLH